VARGRAGVAPYGRPSADRSRPVGAGRTTSSAAGAGAMGSEEGNPVRVPRATGMRWCASMARLDPGRALAGGGPRVSSEVQHGRVVPLRRLARSSSAPSRSPAEAPAGCDTSTPRCTVRRRDQEHVRGGLRYRGTGRSSGDHVALTPRAENVRQIAPSPPRSSADPCTTHLLSTPVDAVVDRGWDGHDPTGTTRETALRPRPRQPPGSR
jgi:hypothetical protein